MADDDWTPGENALVVRSYFSMLRDDLAGIKVNKAEVRRKVLPKLRDRSRPALEYKYRNVSRILIEHGLPYVRGYRPAKNYQRALAEAVARFLARAPVVVPKPTSAAEPLLGPRVRVRYGAPPTVSPSRARDVVLPPRRASKVDWSEVEARDRRTGDAGERLVMEAQRRALRLAGRPDLAARVRHVAQEEGDGAGFDILGFTPRGRPRHIEVKSTTAGPETAFYLSAGELDFARANAVTWELHRVYDLGRGPGAYVLRLADIEERRIVPVAYRVMPAIRPSGPES